MRIRRADEVLGADHEWLQPTPAEQADYHGVTQAAVGARCSRGNRTCIEVTQRSTQFRLGRERYSDGNKQFGQIVFNH